MRRLSLSISIISLTLWCVINAQVDPQLCPNGPTAPILDPRWRPVPSRFEIITELISGNSVIEISQTFSRNRDAIKMNANWGLFDFYWYFDTNEQLEIVHTWINQQVVPICLRQVIDLTSETSVLTKRTLFLKPSVLLGFDSRNQVNANWGIKYDGDQVLRGIPANRFKSCFYLYDIRATVSATYYVSDVDKFQAYLPSNTSIILQIDVVVRSQTSEESYQYNVFRYTPNPRRSEERQALETPAGIYCPNRTLTLNVPKDLPERATENSEVFVPQINSSIFSSRNYYDTELQFSRYDLWYSDPSRGTHSLEHTELHDFSTGLSYQYNQITHQCTVRNISLNVNDAVVVDGKPDLVQMSSLEHLFLMDNVSYQYTGEKPCRDGVWCHVWIAEETLTADTVEQREWYWSSIVNGEQTAKSVPMKIIIKRYVNHSISMEAESIIFNFHRDSDTYFESNQMMANCYQAMGPENNFNLGIISFTIANDNKYPVHQNMNYLQYKIWETLIFSLSVRPIRISNIVVDRDDKDLLVAFTLLDAPPNYGPVEAPTKDTSLRKLIERLRALIDGDGLVFRAKYDTKEVILRSRNNSLQIIYTSVDQNVTQCVNHTVTPSLTSTVSTDTTTIITTTTTTTPSQDLEQHIDIVYKSSGPLITGFWIGFIILGLFIGIIGGFFALKRFSK